LETPGIENQLIISLFISYNIPNHEPDIFFFIPVVSDVLAVGTKWIVDKLTQEQLLIDNSMFAKLQD